MKKTLLKTFLFLAIGISTISSAIFTSSSFSKNVVAEDQRYGVTATWSYDQDDVALRDNDADYAFGGQWKWSSGNKRIHIAVADDLLPAGLDSVKSETIYYNHYKNANGAVCVLRDADGNVPSSGWLGFDGSLLDHNTISVVLNSYASTNIAYGWTVTLNGQAKFINANSWDSSIGDYAKQSMDYIIEFNNVVFVWNGRGWSKSLSDVHTLDPDGFSSKTNDAWMVTAFNSPAGVTLSDYSFIPASDTWFKGDATVRYIHADKTTEDIKAGFYTHGTYHHSAFVFTKAYTGKDTDIIPEKGDSVIISGTWNTVNGITIVFSKPFTLEYAQGQWYYNADFYGTITEEGLSTLNPDVTNYIYFNFDNTAGIPYDTDWEIIFNSSTSTIGTIKHASGAADDQIKISVVFINDGYAAIFFDSWATGLSERYDGVDGDIVTIDGYVTKGNMLVYLDLKFEYTDATTGWVPHRDTYLYADAAFDSSATNKGVLRVFAVTGYTTDNISSYSVTVKIDTKDEVTITKAMGLKIDTVVAGNYGEHASYAASTYGGVSAFGIEVYGLAEGNHTIVVSASVVEKNIEHTFSTASTTYNVVVSATATTIVTE